MNHAGEDLLNAAVRISLAKTDQTPSSGRTFKVRAEAVALTGHRFPAGFSQERTAYIQLSVTDDNGFLLYQSGYVVDKPHPETGEMKPDGNLDDEDHGACPRGRSIPAITIAIPSRPYPPGNPPMPATPIRCLKPVRTTVPTRACTSAHRRAGTVPQRADPISVPGQSLGGHDANGNPIVASRAALRRDVQRGVGQHGGQFPFAAAFGAATFNYEIKLPTQEELTEMGVSSVRRRCMFTRK